MMQLKHTMDRTLEKAKKRKPESGTISHKGERRYRRYWVYVQHLSHEVCSIKTLSPTPVSGVGLTVAELTAKETSCNASNNASCPWIVPANLLDDALKQLYFFCFMAANRGQV